MTLEQEILAELRALRSEVAELRESLKTKKRAAATSAIPTPEFEGFWHNYPRKVSKKAAWFAFRSLNKSEQEHVMKVLPDWVASWKNTEMQYIPHASTWLNQRRFLDVIQQAVPVQQALPRTNDEWQALGREKGIFPAAGESWAAFKDRVAAS